MHNLSYENEFHSPVNETHFQMRGCAPRLALNKRRKTTKKWLIHTTVLKFDILISVLFLNSISLVVMVFSKSSSFNYNHYSNAAFPKKCCFYASCAPFDITCDQSLFSFCSVKHLWEQPTQESMRAVLKFALVMDYI